jgi:hypothetical protein
VCGKGGEEKGREIERKIGKGRKEEIGRKKKEAKKCSSFHVH